MGILRRNKRKICVVTGTRAEYGLLYWLMRFIKESKELDLQLVVTGMHLSPEFGSTYESILEDGFKIDKKVEMLLSSDSEVAITKSIGLGIIGFADALSELKPHIMVVLGDRYEVLAAATAATISRIPIAHIHGGEKTEGLIDEAIRHSVTKMSHLHFTSTAVYRNRVIQLGENPDRVFNFGAVGIDIIKNRKLMTREQFESSIGISLGKNSLMVTYHPTTLENKTSQEQFQNLLKALDNLSDTKIIFTKANADTNGRIINFMIDEYVSKNSHKSVAFTSLGQHRYISAMQYVNGIVGNSSSGLIEAPSFKIGTINIGDRQRGRIKASSVIDCEANFLDIKRALNLLLSPKFQRTLNQVINPYGEGGASKKIIAILKKFELSNILKKRFYERRSL